MYMWLGLLVATSLDYSRWLGFIQLEMKAKNGLSSTFKMFSSDQMFNHIRSTDLNKLEDISLTQRRGCS